MKAVWVDEGNDADPVKLARNGITHPYFSIRDPRVTRTYLNNVLREGYAGVGVFVDRNWGEFKDLNPVAFAEEVSRRVAKLFVSFTHPRVQFDNERKDPEDIAISLERWRELRKNQATSWTMESGQGGWMSLEFVNRIIACRVRLAPQLYNGDMTEVRDSLTYARDLTKRGFPDNIISPFYDAAHLPAGWDGFAFTMGRLP